MIENFDNKNIQSFEYETSINSDGNIAGTCELGNATIQMLNDSNEYSSLKGQWIKTNHGSFYIHSVEPVQEKVNIKLSCYDVKYKLDTPYDSSLYTWPMTLKEWRNQIGTNCGITFDNSDFPNSDLILNEEPYIGDNPSNRNVVSIIAQAGCSWVDTDKDDIFYFNWFDNTIHIVNDWIELTTEKEMSSPINVVVLGRGDVEDNVKWPENLPENPVEFRIDNNYILDPQESTEDKRYDVIETIYNRVNGFKYLVFNIRIQDIFNKLSIKLGQIVTYRDMWGNVLSANIMSKKITYLGGNLEDDDNYEITLSAEEIKETSTEYSYASSIENKLRKTQISVDKQNQRIETIASDVNENAEKVASLEITTGNISTKVSSVEKDLSTTNTNLSNLSNTVDTLSNDINGVSADFEDFKDNEYIQSIDNLQKQIDGAIQFWNGAEIPTLNNYPANQWTTENDRINHQADIYTVVQDVEGEMKQGKSYRFDKVNGVWQWIELTDNELSAVQAIAQEALNKANANATEIGTVKTKVSSLEQTDEQIKASVESIDKQIIPTASVSDSNIYIEDASDDPLIRLEIEGKSVQKGTPTPETPVEIESVGYTNLLTGNFRKGNFAGSVNDIRLFSDDNYYIEKGRTYTFSTNAVEKGLEYGVNTASVKFPIPNIDYINFDTGWQTKETITFTATTNGYLGIPISKVNKEETISLDDLNDVWFTLTETSEYVPEGKYVVVLKMTNETDINTLSIILNEPLRSLPNGVEDKLYIKNNKLYIDRYVGNVVFNGDEDWVFETSTITPTNRSVVRKYFVSTNNNAWLSNRFIMDTEETPFDGNILTIRSDVIYLSTKDEITGISSTDDDATKLSKIKTYLSTHNAEVDYELATPITEEVGEIEIPSTFKGVNHITTTDEPEPVLNIEYVRDTTLSNYVEGQINKVMTIEERHYSELVIEDNSIKESVESVNSSLNGLNTTINRVEEITTDNSQVINVISTNIDKVSGEVREVTTTTGFTFNADGMTINDGSGFKAQHRSNGTYYKDGETIVGQYTKDGSKQKDLELFGTYSYGKESINDTPMFVGQLYTDENGEQGFGHFYNGEG